MIYGCIAAMQMSRFVFCRSFRAGESYISPGRSFARSSIPRQLQWPWHTMAAGRRQLGRSPDDGRTDGRTQGAAVKKEKGEGAAGGASFLLLLSFHARRQTNCT